MSFDWMDVRPQKPVSGRFRDQFVRAVRERAQLHCNLNFLETSSVQRIQADLHWEFDSSAGSTKMPRFYAEVPAIVASVYEHKRAKSTPAKNKKTSPKRRSKKKRE